VISRRRPVSRPDPVGDPGGFPGQVVVEPEEHFEVGQDIFPGIDAAQGVGVTSVPHQ
jgi:hypothetical protein